LQRIPRRDEIFPVKRWPKNLLSQKRFVLVKRQLLSEMAEVYYGPSVATAPRRVEVIESRPPVEVFGYHYTPTSLAGMIIAIVIMIIAIVVVIWLIQAGINIANQVVANGARRGFPIPYIVGIVLGIIVLIVTIMIIIWVITVARRATRAATGMTRLSPASSYEVAASAPPPYRTNYL
jgi:hypothetical protein